MANSNKKVSSKNSSKKPVSKAKTVVKKPASKPSKPTKVVSKDGKTNKKRSVKLLIIEIILIALLLFIVAAFIAGWVFFSTIVKEAPEFDPKNLYTQESSIVYGPNGEEIAKLGSEKREKITYDDMPQVLIDAIVATEDSTFFQHNGFNAARFMKASVSQVLGGTGGGASTLTMQVSKNAYTSDVSSGFEGIKRKFTDIYLSIFKIEKTYTKEQILEFYVNSYYMGGGAYGVEQACQNYFGKSVNNINLAEAALLAGIYQAPNSYDPTLYPERTEERRQTVLNLMVRHGYITEEEREIASKLTVDKLLNTKKSDGQDQIDPRYKDFIDTVVEDVQKKTGGLSPYTTPMLIYTTMDPGKQEYVTNLMNGSNFNWENDKVQAGIAVVDTNTGAIVAIGAGRKREGLDYNYATMIKRQIGSTSKPLFDYGPLIQYENASTYHFYYDEDYTYSGGTPIRNWDNTHNGMMTMREALRTSRNIPALKAFQENQNENIVEFVTSLGLSPEIEDGRIHEAHSIGAYNGESPLTVAAAYAAFANGGYYTEPYTFTKIVYRNSEEVYEYKPKATKVMDDSTAYMVADMLVTTSGWAVGYNNVNGVTFGSKTGTSNYSDEIMAEYNLPYDAVNDLWVAGICRDYATALWYGYDSIDYNHGKGNTQLYSALIQGVFTGAAGFDRPSSVVSVTVEKDSPGNGLLPSQFTPDGMKVTELFKAGTEPTQVSDRFAQLPDVTNLTGSVSGNEAKLSWSAIETPHAFSADYYNNLYASSCRNVGACSGIIIGANQGILGGVQYAIYFKDSHNQLNFLTKVSETSAKVAIPAGAAGHSATFVVKATYANYDAPASNGVEVTVDASNVKNISFSMNGKSEVNSTPGKYKDEGVTVTVNGSNVTSSCNCVTTYVNGSSVSSVNLTTPGDYVIKYEINYSGKKDSFVRNVHIK